MAKHDLFDWIDLALKNTKVLVSLGLLLCGTSFYTVYDLVGKKHIVEKPEVVKSIPAEKTVIESVTCPTVVCGCDETIKGYHE